MRFFIFIIVLFLGFNGLAQSSGSNIRNGILVIEQLDYKKYVSRRNNILKSAYEENQIDSLNSLSDFEGRDYNGYLEMYQELTSGFAKNNWQFIQLKKSEYDSLKNSTSDSKHYFIELNLVVNQFKSGGLALISGFDLYNSRGALIYNEGAKRLINKIKKQAP